MQGEIKDTIIYSTLTKMQRNGLASMAEMKGFKYSNADLQERFIRGKIKQLAGKFYEIWPFGVDN